MTEHSPPSASTLQLVYVSVPRRLVLALTAVALVGAGLILVGRMTTTDFERRLGLAYLVAFAFALSLTLGSLFFVLLQHLTRAGWSVLVRRPAEVFAMNVITVAVLFVPLGWAVSQGRIYPWAAIEASGPQAATDLHVAKTPRLTEVKSQQAGHPTHDASNAEDPRDAMYVHQQVDGLTLSKASWLNPQFFLLRVALYFAIWLVLAGWYFNRSRRQDSAAAAGGVQATRHMEWTAGVAAIAFALSLTFAAFDLLMSLDPHWYSTMFGVYFFAGCALGAMALNTLTWLLLVRWRVVPEVLSAEHRRDLGRLLFAFVFFWGYIAFSQYMLLWYANVPETTRWFVVRGASQATGYANSWGFLLIVLLFGHLLIPFLGIMSRHVKASSRAMLFWTIWLLVMHYLDLYWLVMPELGPHLTFGPLELGSLLLVGGIYSLGASLLATRTSLIPIGDPRLGESVQLTEMY